MREGVYYIDSTIEFDTIDSHGNDSSITLTACDGENVRLSGGIDIPFSQLEAADNSFKARIIDTSAADKIKMVNLREMGITNYGELSRRGFQVSAGQPVQMLASVDGKNMRLAAWPNNGFTVLKEKVASGERTQEGVLQGCSYKYDDADATRLSRWAEPGIGYVSGVLGPNYAYDYYPIDRIDKANKTVYLSEGAIYDYYSAPFFKYENIPEELDVPGEYYIDRVNGVLYLYPPEGSDKNSTLTLSMLEDDMIRINGATDVTIKNIELDSGRKSAIVSTNGAEKIAVEDCKIHNFGKDGVSLTKTKYSIVRDCEVYDTGESGIKIGGGDYANIMPACNEVFGNDVHDFAQIERSYRAGVYVDYQSVGTVIRHNYIHDAPHAAIIFYGVNNLFENNEITNVVREFHDSDAIYVNNSEFPWERGNVIRRNYLHDIGNEVLGKDKQMNISGVRSDNHGHGLNVYHNVFQNIGEGRRNGISGVCAQGMDNIIRENLFVDCNLAYNANQTYNANAQYQTTGNPVYERMQAYNAVYTKRFPELSDFWQRHYDKSKTNVFSNNIISNIAFEFRPENTQNIQQQRYWGRSELVTAEGNLVSDSATDIGFEDYSNNRFKLSDSGRGIAAVNGHTDFDIVCIGHRK